MNLIHYLYFPKGKNVWSSEAVIHVVLNLVMMAADNENTSFFSHHQHNPRNDCYQVTGLGYPIMQRHTGSFSKSVGVLIIKVKNRNSNYAKVPIRKGKVSNRNSEYRSDTRRLTKDRDRLNVRKTR